jgi:hypothetical protein
VLLDEHLRYAQNDKVHLGVLLSFNDICEVNSKHHTASKKGAIWVLRDEHLHCVQNDKGQQSPPIRLCTRPVSVQRCCQPKGASGIISVSPRHGVYFWKR